MRKTLSYILVVFSLFLLLEGVKASEYTCKYAKLEMNAVAPTHPDFGDFTKGTIDGNTSMSLKVINGNIKWSNVTVKNIDGGHENIVNWKEERGGFSAQKYAESEACPPYALALDDVNGQWEYFVFETSEQAQAISNTKENVNTEISLKLVEGPQLSSNNNDSESSRTEQNVETFNCEVGGYTLEYNTDGELVLAKLKSSGEIVDKYLSSYFKPKNVSECPSDTTAKINFIDGRRTFYVAKIDETFTSQESDSNTETQANSCLDFKEKGDCEQGNAVHCEEWGCSATSNFACLWNETKYGDYCNTDKLLYVKCGDAKDIPHQVPQVVSFAVNLLKIATPLILIFVSIITLLKAISSGNEDEMKKAQKGLIRKIIAAVMVFFVISIVQFVIMKVADTEIKSDVNEKTENKNLSDCLNCFLNNKCGDSVYYKTYIGSDLTETFLSENNE